MRRLDWIQSSGAEFCTTVDYIEPRDLSAAQRVRERSCAVA